MKLNDFWIAENIAYNFIFSIDIYKPDQSVNKIKNQDSFFSYPPHLVVGCFYTFWII